MATTFLHYQLTKGYLHNWLVAGPLVVAVPGVDTTGADAAERIVQRYYEPESGVGDPPVDVGPLGPLTKDHPALTWRYYPCREDHFVDLMIAHSTWGYARGWAYAQLHVAAAQDVRLILTSHGPADVWLNGQHLHRQAQLD